MSLTQEQIKKLANNLCKLGDSEEKLGSGINEILKYIDLLGEIDTTGVSPTISVIEKDFGAPLRKDVEEEKIIKREELLKCSNQKVIQNQIAISNIM